MEKLLTCTFDDEKRAWVNTEAYFDVTLDGMKSEDEKDSKNADIIDETNKTTPSIIGSEFGKSCGQGLIPLEVS